MTKHKQTTRIAGIWYLSFILLGAFSMMFVDENLSIAGNTAATIENFRTNAMLYYLGLATYIMGYVCFIFSVNALCKIFKPVDNRLTQLMRAFVLVGVVVALISKLAQLISVVAPSIESQSNTATMLLSFYTRGETIAGIFWGLWLLPLGLLILQSKLISKVIGILLLMACAGHLIDFFVSFFTPDSSQMILSVMYAFEMLGEFALVLWLLIRGVKVQEQKSN